MIFFWKMMTSQKTKSWKSTVAKRKINIVVNFSLSGIYHLHIVIRHFSIRIFSSEFYHPHFVICIFPSAIHHPPSATFYPRSIKTSWSSVQTKYLGLLAVKRKRIYIYIFNTKTEGLNLEVNLKISTMICRSKIRRTWFQISQNSP